MKEPDWAAVAREVLRGMQEDGHIITRGKSALQDAYALGKSHGPDWLPIADAPRDGRTIIVEGGTAYWDGEAWYSDQAQAEIQWQVTSWQPLPPAPEPKS